MGWYRLNIPLSSRALASIAGHALRSSLVSSAGCGVILAQATECRLYLYCHEDCERQMETETTQQRPRDGRVSVAASWDESTLTGSVLSNYQSVCALRQIASSWSYHLHHHHPDHFTVSSPDHCKSLQLNLFPFHSRQEENLRLPRVRGTYYF